MTARKLNSAYVLGGAFIAGCAFMAAVSPGERYATQSVVQHQTLTVPSGIFTAYNETRIAQFNPIREWSSKGPTVKKIERVILFKSGAGSYACKDANLDGILDACNDNSPLHPAAEQFRKPLSKKQLDFFQHHYATELYRQPQF